MPRYVAIYGPPGALALFWQTGTVHRYRVLHGLPAGAVPVVLEHCPDGQIGLVWEHPSFADVPARIGMRAWPELPLVKDLGADPDAGILVGSVAATSPTRPLPSRHARGCCYPYADCTCDGWKEES